MSFVPPPLTCDLTWRELYADEAFGQRQLVPLSSFRSATSDRGVFTALGPETWERFDGAGAFRPVAFSLEGWFAGASARPAADVAMRFSEEIEAGGWSAHEWEHEWEPGLPNVTSLYSPWQLLYVADVVDGTNAPIDLDTALNALEPEHCPNRLREFLLADRARWMQLHEKWAPLLKLLVAVQNTYWPIVSNRHSLATARDHQGWVVAGSPPQQPDALLAQLGCSAEEVLDAYQFLLERGLKLDPRDGFTLLRRARPRAFHLRWRGVVRRAQDAFDAAQVLRLWLLALGQDPLPPAAMPMDGRQHERRALYDRGPASSWTADDVKAELLEVQLYPHGVHLLGEGVSEQIVVGRVVEHFLGSAAAAEIAFTDLGGSGAARTVAPLTTTLGGYAARAVVIVDNEGDMRRFLDTAVADGEISRDDICLFDDSLEAANATPDELVRLAIAMKNAAGVSDTLELTGDELIEIHNSRTARTHANNPPGLADTLLREVAARTETRLRLEKVALADELANLIISDIEATFRDEPEALGARRPIVPFVVERIVEVLNQPRPAGGSI